MTSTVDRPRVATRGPLPWGLIVAATLLAAGTIVVIWTAAVPFGPLVCPAIYPAPRNCFASDRAGTGLTTSIVVGLVYLVTILVAVIGGRRLRTWVIAGVVVLAVAPPVAYLSVAWLPGFVL